jgi:chromosome segregation ATPase
MSELGQAGSDIAAFQREFERDFEAFAGALIALSSKARDLDERLGTIAAEAKRREGGPTLKALSRLRAQYELSLQRGTQLGATLANEGDGVREAARSMAERLQKIERLTERLRFAGMNAIIGATRSGVDGTAFSALARELTGLTHWQLPLAHRLSSAAARLRSETSALLAARTDAAEPDHAVRPSGADVIADLIATTVEISRSDHLNALGGRVADFQELVGRAVLGLQRQDIVRQKLDHVRTLLDESVRESRSLGPPDGQAGRAEGLCFLEKAEELAAGLLRETLGDLASLYSETEAATSSTAAALREVEGIRGRLVNQIENRLRVCAVAIEQLEQALRAQGKQGEARQGAIADIVGSLKDVRADFNTLGAILRRLRSLRTLMRIEIVSTASLATEAAVLTEIDDGEQAMSVFLSANESALEGLAAIFAKLANLGAGLEESRGQLAQMTAASRELCAEILRTGSEVLRSFEGIVVLTVAMESQTGELGAALRGLDSKVSSLTKVADVIAASAAGRRRLRRDEFGAEAEALASGANEKLSALTRRFTVLSHKKLGGAVTNTDVAEGDAGGTLTLF